MLMKFNSYWVSGFVDGEGTFYVGINKNSEMSVGYQVFPEFRIVQHKKDIQLLHGLKSFFSCGVVRKNHGDRYEFRVRSIENLYSVIIPFFEKHSLHTRKKFDFLKFRKVVRMMKDGKHLTKDGVIRIIEIARQMNRKDKPIAQKHQENLKLDKNIVRTS